MRKVLVLVALAGALGAGVLLLRDGPAGTWERLPAPPFDARERAIGAWTGREVLVFGGSDAPPCPGNASCAPTTIPPLRDGAAFDPATRRWSRIADAPVAFDYAPEPVVLDGTVYLFVPGTDARPGAPRAFLAYSPEEDRWKRLRLPPSIDEGARLLTAGHRVVAFGTDPPLAYDPGTRRWAELPPVESLWMVWAGDRLVSFHCEQPGDDEGVCLTTAAVLESDRWRRLPGSDINWRPGSWTFVGGKVVSPSLGDSNSGRQQQSRPVYPNGGFLDLERERWAPLPDPPDADEVSGNGVLARYQAAYLSDHGYVLDLDRSEWLRLPELRDVELSGQTIVSAGRSLFIYGGARFDELQNRAWLWSPPRA